MTLVYGRGLDPGQKDYLDAWLEEGGALAVYGSIGNGGGGWLRPALQAALAAGKRVKILDLARPDQCEGLPAGMAKLLAGRDITWPVAEQVALQLTALLEDRDTVLCIRSFASTFLEPATRAGSSAAAIRDLLRKARDKGFPLCVAMPSAHGQEDLLTSFKWVWCLGFDENAKDRSREVQIFGRAAQMPDPDALWQRPPIARQRAMIVNFGGCAANPARVEIPIEGFAGAAA